MGGFGSGTWYRFARKRTVEESLTLAAGDFTDRLHSRSTGKFVWTWPAGHESEVAFRVSWDAQGPVVSLHYQWSDAEKYDLRVRLQATPTNFHGQRWWFTCPLGYDGVACKRRVRKLHLPPGSRYFGCRLCHNLTYNSCRRAHRVDRFLQFIRGNDPKSVLNI
jgi:hypothetical protein